MIVDDVVEQVHDLLASSPYRDAADEVVSFLRLVADRDRHVAALAGEPKLMETEALAQSYAGAFHREAFATVVMIDGGAMVALLEPLGVTDARGFTKRLRDGSELIALKHGRAYVYPEFQFDPAKHKVRKVVADANLLLLAGRDPWGALAWWTSENPRWGRRRPIDYPDDERVVTLAGAVADDGF